MAQGEKKSMREKNKEGRKKDKRHVRVFMCLNRLRVKRINAKINVYIQSCKYTHPFFLETTLVTY